MKKAIIISALALTLLGLVSYGTAKAYAQGGPNNHSTIIEKLVDRFGLNKEEVETVFEEVRQERQQQGQARFEERLSQAVEEGKITEEQKQAVIDKKAEMQADCQQLKDLSPEERKETMENHHQEMKTWVEEQGIDLTTLPLFLGRGPRGGLGRRPFDQ